MTTTFCWVCGYIGEPKQLDMPYSDSEGGEVCPECGNTELEDFEYEEEE